MLACAELRVALTGREGQQSPLLCHDRQMQSAGHPYVDRFATISHFQALDQKDMSPAYNPFHQLPPSLEGGVSLLLGYHLLEEGAVHQMR